MRRIAILFAALSLAACAHDFDAFDATGDGAPGEGGPTSDASSTDGSSDGSTIVDAGIDASCGVTCFDAAKTCAAACDQTEMTCESMCGGGGCRSMCRGARTVCKLGCAGTCNSCTNSAGCGDPAGCAQASN